MADGKDELLQWAEGLSSQKPRSSNPKADALRRAADTLGVDAGDLGSIISFETGGTFDPHKVGGEGNRYKGLIQFGPEEQQKYYRPNDTFETQLEKGVVPYFQERFRKAGKDTRGASLEDLYTTVIAGNPAANRNAKDSFGTSAKSGTKRIESEHRPKVLQSFFDGADTRVNPDDIFAEVESVLGADTAPQVPVTGEKRFLRPGEPLAADIPPAPVTPTNPTQAPFRPVQESLSPLTPSPVGGEAKAGEAALVPPLPPQVIGMPSPTPMLDQAEAMADLANQYLSDPTSVMAPPPMPVQQPQQPQKPATAPAKPKIQVRPRGSQPVVRENRTTPTNEQPSAVADGPVDVEITLTDKPASKSYSDWVDEKRASALAIKLGADYDTVRSVLKSFGSPTVGKSSKQADEDYYAGLAKQGDQNKFQVGSDVVRAIKLADQTNKKRQAAADSDFEQRKAAIDPNLSAADHETSEFEQRMLADVDAGLVSPVDAVKAVDKFKQDVDAWKQDRGFFGLLDQEQSATLQAGLSAGGRKYSEDLTGGVQFDGKAKSPKELFDRAYADVKKQYGSISEWADTQREFKKRFKDKPNLFLMKAGETAVGAAAKAPLKGVSSALKTVSIAAEAIDRGLGDENADATKMGFYQMGKALDEITEGVIKIDPDFKGGSAELFGDVFGQVATQIGIGVITGGAAAPALFGAGMGAAAEFEEADKREAKGWERLGAAGVGGALAASDYILFRKWFGSASPADKGKFLQRFRDNVRTSLETKGVIRSAADKAAVQMTDGMFATLAKQSGIKGVIGRGGQQVTSKGKEGLKEAFQEGVFETKGNDLYAYLTYDPTPERLDELTRITGENLIEGVAGFFGGVIGASAGEITRRASSLSPEAVVQAEAVVEKLQDTLPPETLEETRKAFAKAKRRTVGLEPESIPAGKSEKPIIPDVAEKPQNIDTKTPNVDAADISPIRVYRGADGPELDKGDFGATFVSRKIEDAAQYGEVREYDLRPQDILDVDSPQALALVREFYNDPSIEDVMDDVPDNNPFLFPDKQWGEFLASKGYKATAIGNDIAIFDPNDLTPIGEKPVRGSLTMPEREARTKRLLNETKTEVSKSPAQVEPESLVQDQPVEVPDAVPVKTSKTPSAQTTKPAEPADSPTAIAAEEQQVIATESGRKTASKTNEVAPKDTPAPSPKRLKAKEQMAGLLRKRDKTDNQNKDIGQPENAVNNASATDTRDILSDKKADNAPEAEIPVSEPAKSLETDYAKASKARSPQTTSFPNEFGSFTSVRVTYRKDGEFGVETTVRKQNDDGETQTVQPKSRVLLASEHEAFIQDLASRAKSAESAKPEAKKPWEMTREEFGDVAAQNKEFREQYRGKSSRTTPSETPIPPVGSWRLDNTGFSKYGNGIEQLQEIPVAKIKGAEDPYSEGRGEDVERYAQWLTEGKTAPPIRAAQMLDGTFKISDGHRRLGAHKNAGKKTILAWVAPSADTGLREPSGKVIDADLTHQLAIKQALESGELTPERAKELGHFEAYPDLIPKSGNETDFATKPESREVKSEAKRKSVTPDGTHADRPAKILGTSLKKGLKIQYLDGEGETTFVKSKDFVKDAKAFGKKAKAVAPPAAETPARVKKYAAQGLSEAEVAAQVNDPEFKAAEEASKKQKASPTTGFTKAQQGYLIKELEEYAAEYPEGAAYEGQKSDLKGQKPVADSSVGYSVANRVKPETIIVPDDGTVTVNDMKQANRLYQRLAGKPIKGQEKEKLKNISMPAPLTGKVTGVSAKRTLSDLGATKNDDWQRGEAHPFTMDVPIDEVDAKYLSGNKKLEAAPALVKIDGRFGSGWLRTSLGKKRAWTDGKMVLVADEAPGAGTTKEEPDSEKILKQTLGSLNVKPVRPMRAVEGAEDALIEFDDGWQIPFEQYQLIKAHYPNVIFEHGEAAEVDEARPFIAYNGKDVVGLIMPVAERNDATAMAAKRAERYKEQAEPASKSESVVKAPIVESKAEESEPTQMDAYLATLTPLQAGRVRKRLEKQTRHKGKLTTVGGLIETFISEGAELTTSKQLHDLTAAERRKYNDEIKQLRRDMTNDRALRESEMPRLTLMVDALNVGYELREVDILKHPDRSVLDNENIGSLAMDYARYLSKAPEPKPEAPAAESKVAKRAERYEETASDDGNEVLYSVPEKTDDILAKIVDDRGKIDYGQVKDVAGRVERGELEIVRLDRQGERGRIAGGRRNVEASLILGANEGTGKAASRGGGGLEARADKQSQQEKLLTDYAREQGIQFNYGRIDNRGEFIGSGVEARVYRDESGTAVIKLVDYKQINKGATPLDFLDRISLFNHLFPESAYELVGFTRDDTGLFRFIVKQPFIIGGPVSQHELEKMMEQRGLYNPTHPETFSNPLYTVFDLHYRNVLKDAADTVFVIDAVPRMNSTALQRFSVEEAEQADDGNVILRSVPESVRDLVTLHNLSEANLQFADRLGGLAMPSLAITKKDAGFTGFGEITLIADKSMIDPKAKVPVTDADMYSPRYPSAKIYVDANLFKAEWEKVKKAWLDNYPKRENYSIEYYIPISALQDDGLRGLTRDDHFVAYALNELGINLPKDPRDLYKSAREHNEQIEEIAQSVVDASNGKMKYFKGYTNLGNKRLGDYTLETVVQQLKSEMKSGEGFNYGAGNIRAAAAKRFKTIAEIQKARGRIVTDAEMEATKEEMQNKLFEIADQAKPFYKYDTERFGYYDQFSEALAEGLKRKNLRREMEEYGFEGLDYQPILEYLETLRNQPTEYFEAKPQRAVKLSEFKAAVVPDDISKKSRGILEKNGLDIVEYSRGDAESRKKAVEQAATDSGVLFSVPGYENVEFEQRPVVIEELLKRDRDLREYVEKNNPEPSRKRLKPVVLAMKPRGGIVVEGMERIAQAISNGKKMIDALVQVGEPYLRSIPTANAIGLPPQTIRGEQRVFAKSVDEVIANTDDRYDPPEVLSYPTPLFLRLGMKEAPIKIHASIIRSKVMPKGTMSHDISPDTLKQLPFGFNDPLMVFDSDTADDAFVVLTDLTDSNGSPIVAAVKKADGSALKYNVVLSVYGKDRLGSFDDWYQKKKLRFINIEKSRDWLRNAELQVSGAEADLTANPNVLTEADFVNDNPSLKKVRTSEAVRELEDLAKVDDFTDLIPKVETSVDGNILHLDSPEAVEWMRTVMAFSEEADRAKAPIIQGTFLNPKNVQQVVDAAYGALEAVQEAEIDAEPIERLIKNLETAMSANKAGTVILDYFDDALPHEQVHEGSYLGADGKPYESRYANAKEIKADKTFKKFHKALNALQGRSSHGVAMEEALAYLGTGDYARFGLTESEAVDLLDKLIVGYADANGLESLKNFQPNTQLYEAIESYRKSQRSGERDASRSGRDSGWETRPSETARESDADREGRGQTSRSESGFEPGGREKLSKTPKTLRNAGIAANNRLYSSTTNAERKNFADEIMNRGLGEAIDWLETQAADGNNNAGATAIVGITVMNELGKRGQIDELNRIADAVLPMVTDAAQTVQAISVVSMYSPDTAVPYATKAAKQAGKDLTPRDAERAGDIARRMSETVQALAVAESSLANADELNRQLREEVNELEDALDISKSKNREFKTKLSGMGRTIAALRRQLEGVLPPSRTRTSKEVRERINEIASRKDDIVERLKARYGVSEFLRMVAWYEYTDTDVSDSVKRMSAEQKQRFKYEPVDWSTLATINAAETDEGLVINESGVNFIARIWFQSGGDFETIDDGMFSLPSQHVKGLLQQISNLHAQSARSQWSFRKHPPEVEQGRSALANFHRQIAEATQKGKNLLLPNVELLTERQDDGFLRSVPGSSDQDLLDYATLHLANYLKTITPKEFKEAIDVMTNGNLTPDEIDAVHAYAVGQLRAESGGVSDDIKQANKNRHDHYRAADEYNLSQLDYKGFKVATKAEKRIAEAILRAGQDFSDEAVWTALARMKYKDPSELIRELRNEFEGLQNEKDVLADSQRIVLLVNQLMYGDRMRKKDATLTDSDLEIIREHRRVLTGTKGRIAREATNFYSGLVKSRAEIVLGSVVDFRRANLLSAVKTHMVNILGNTGFAASEEIAKAPAAMIDMAAAMFTNERTIALTPTAINRGLKALVAKDETLANADWESPEGREAGIKAAKHVLMYGGSLADMERHQYSESILQETFSGRIPKWIDNYINYSFRTLGAEDAFFKVYSFRRHIEEQAKAIALTEKRQGNLEGTVADRQAELVKKPTNVMQVIADNYAHMMTFQNDNALSSLIATIKRGRPVLKAGIETIVPYDRTPTNIVIRTLEYTPLGVPMAVYAIKGKKPSKEFRNAFTMPVTADVAGSTDIQKLTKEQRAVVEDQINRLWSREKQANFSRTMARASVGSSLFGVGFALAALGLMAGAMDFDDKDKNEKDLAWQRKSEGIESGSIWLPMLDIRIQLPMSPATVMLTAGATFYEQIKMSRKDTALAAMDAGVESFVDIAEKQPYINSTYGLMRNLGKEKYGEFTGNLLSGYVPASAMVRSISEVADSKERTGSGFRKGENLKNSGFWWNRQWRGFRNSLLKGVPGARNYLVDESTSGASPQERGNVPRRIVRMLDPFNTRTGKPSPVPEGVKPGQDTRPFKDTPEAKKMTTDDVVSLIQFEREAEKDVSDLVEMLMQKAKNAHSRKTLTDAEIQNIRKVLPDFTVADLAKVKKPKKMPGAKMLNAGQ